MKVSLNAVQRINLHAIMAMQTGKPSQLFRYRSIMERVRLSKEQEVEIEQKVEDGRIFWHPEKAEALIEECPFSPEDAAVIHAALENSSFFREGDLKWLEPMLDAFAPQKQV